MIQMSGTRQAFYVDPYLKMSRSCITAWLHSCFTIWPEAFLHFSFSLLHLFSLHLQEVVAILSFALVFLVRLMLLNSSRSAAQWSTEEVSGCVSAVSCGVNVGGLFFNAKGSYKMFPSLRI